MTNQEIKSLSQEQLAVEANKLADKISRYEMSNTDFYGNYRSTAMLRKLDRMRDQLDYMDSLLETDCE